MNRNIIAFVGIAAASALAVILSRRQDHRKIILPEQLQESISQGESILLLDVRTAGEFNSGHIPGAILLPHDSVLSSQDSFPQQRDSMIVVYCERGPRARVAQKALSKSGFSKVLHLKGDMSAWRASGRPIDMTPADKKD